MPINIYIEEISESTTYLAEDNWELASQIHTLSEWLSRKDLALPSKRVLADIGFNGQPGIS